MRVTRWVGAAIAIMGWIEGCAEVTYSRKGPEPAVAGDPVLGRRLQPPAPPTGPPQPVPQAPPPANDPSAWPPLVPTSGTIGGVGPVRVEAAAADGHWIVLCQARRDTNGDGRLGVSVGYHGDLGGDEVRPYVVRGEGEGELIDAFIDASADGRWLAVVAKNKLALWGTRSTERVDLSRLGALPTLGSHPLAPAPLSFDPASARFLYHRERAGQRRRAILRDLATGAEQVLAHGTGLLYGGYLPGTGEAVLLVHPARGHARLPATTLAPRGCRGNASSASFWGGSKLEHVVVPLDVPARAPTPRATEPPDERWLATAPDGARVIAVARDDARRAVLWRGPDGHERDTGWTLGPAEAPGTAEVRRLWLHWSDDGTTWLVDLATGAALVAPFESDLAGHYGARAFLLRRSDGWAAVADLSAGTLVTLPVRTAPYQPYRVVGRWAFAHTHERGAVLIDLDRATISAGDPEAEVLALTPDGHLLLPEPRPPTYVLNALPMGPLRWHAPLATTP